MFKQNLKGRETREQIANIGWIREKAREFKTNKQSTSVSLTEINYLTEIFTIKCGKVLRDGNVRPPYLPPEKTVCRSSNS